MPLRDTLFCQNVLFTLHRHSHVGRDSARRIMLMEALSQKKIRLKSTTKRTCMILHSTECMCTQQSRYETPGDSGGQCDSSYWIVSFCERYWLAGIGRRGSGLRALGGQDLPTCELDVRTERAVWAVTKFLRKKCAAGQIFDETKMCRRSDF